MGQIVGRCYREAAKEVETMMSPKIVEHVGLAHHDSRGRYPELCSDVHDFRVCEAENRGYCSTMMIGLTYPERINRLESHPAVLPRLVKCCVSTPAMRGSKRTTLVGENSSNVHAE